MIVLIDNYDSFTYNLVQKLGEVAPRTEMKVFRNDKVTVDEVELLTPTHIVISPGPCTPKEGGVSNDIIKHFAPKLPRKTRAIVATVVVEAVSGMLFSAARLDDATNSRLIEETKRMLRAYLREVLAQHDGL